MLKASDILPAEEIRAWDRFTVEEKGITSLDLMDQAALALTNHWAQHQPTGSRVLIVCGAGGNGGDGLAMGRILADRGYQISFWLCETPHQRSDTALQWQRVNNRSGLNIIPADRLPQTKDFDTLIDALRGNGTSRPAVGQLKQQIEWINQSGLPVVSIDLPSGMPGNTPFSSEWPIIRADHTLCLDPIKLNLLLPESAPWRGKVSRISFGLSAHFRATQTLATLNRASDLAAQLPDRPRFMHKGTAGHALLIAGSGKYPGAAWLCAEACARAGAGRTTLSSTLNVWKHPPDRLSEVIKHLSGTDSPSVFPVPQTHQTVAIGPGIGTAGITASALRQYLKSAGKCSARLILDADALNILSVYPKWKDRLPSGSILTPHPVEFDRLTAVHANSWERLTSLKQLAEERGWVVVLKNAFTFTANGEGKLFLNARGNTALARGGSGDVLTGLMAALSARGTPAVATARIASWILGRAAECAAALQGEEGLLLSDMLQHLPQAFADLRNDSGSDEFFGYF